jgi:hypothetical protein
MLSRCLNSACGTPFQYREEGRVFSIERIATVPGNAEPQRLVEHYWLCGTCSRRLKVVVEDGSVTTLPIVREPVAGEFTKRVLVGPTIMPRRN